MSSGRDRERLDAQQVADMIGYSVGTIQAWHNAGKMPPVAPPKKREWYRRDINKWIEDNFETA